MKKIKQYLPTTPGRALYCKAEKIGNVYNVDYYYGLDESFKVFNVPPLASVLTLKDLAFITQDPRLQEEADEDENRKQGMIANLAGWISKNIGIVIAECMKEAAAGEKNISGQDFGPSTCVPYTYIVTSDIQQYNRKFPVSIYSNIDGHYEKGDSVQIADPHELKGLRYVNIVAPIGEGRVVDNEQEIKKWYSMNEEALSNLGMITEYASQDKMQKIKKDPNLGKQAKRVLRKPPGGKKGSGDLEQDDVRGPGRFPHSETEQAFWNFHKEWSKDPRRDEGPQDGLQSMQYITGKEVEKLLFKKKVNESLEFNSSEEELEEGKSNTTISLSSFLQRYGYDEQRNNALINKAYRSPASGKAGEKVMLLTAKSQMDNTGGLGTMYGRTAEIQKIYPAFHNGITDSETYFCRFLTTSIIWSYAYNLNNFDEDDFNSGDLDADEIMGTLSYESPGAPFIVGARSGYFVKSNFKKLNEPIFHWQTSLESIGTQIIDDGIIDPATGEVANIFHTKGIIEITPWWSGSVVVSY